MFIQALPLALAFGLAFLHPVLCAPLDTLNLPGVSVLTPSIHYSSASLTPGRNSIAPSIHGHLNIPEDRLHTARTAVSVATAKRWWKPSIMDRIAMGVRVRLRRGRFHLRRTLRVRMGRRCRGVTLTRSSLRDRFWETKWEHVMGIVGAVSDEGRRIKTWQPRLTK